MTGMVQIGGSPVQTGPPRRLEKDPVCGMNVDPSSAAATVSHIGKTYYFCCRGCADKFQADALRYLGGGGSPAAVPQASKPTSATKDSPYVCPMDPEIRQDHPGACPKCGMALEPETPLAAKTQWTCPMHPEIVRDCAGRVPHLRHGAGANGRVHNRRESRTPRDDLALLDQRGFRRSTRRLLHVADDVRCSTSCRRTWATGLNSRWRRRSCSGADGRSSSAAGRRSNSAARTCSR